MNDEQRPPPPPDSSPTQAWQAPPPQLSGGHPFGHVQAPPPPPRSGPPIALALVAVVLVVGIGLIAGYVFFLAGPAAPRPSPTATPVAASPTPPPTTPTTTATPADASPTTPPDGSPGVGRTPPPDVRAAIEQVVAQIPPLRELEPQRDVPYVLLTRAEAAQELLGALEEEIDETELQAQERLLQRLALLADDADLMELFSELYTASVAAYYRPDTGSFYIIERAEPFGPADRMFVAHEYTHALQDQHYDLEGTRITDNAQGDAQLAQLAAIEGDASLAMYFWAFSNLDESELLELFQDLTPTDPELLERMPPILRRQLAFPYNEGFVFSNAVFGAEGWEGINETLTDPPASTEQILHPELYFDGELPVDVELPEVVADLGDGWQVAYEQTMGELNIQIWLADGEEPPMTIPGLPGEPTDWQAAAAGWGGDRLEMYEHADGRWAIVWETAWDTAADADEFVGHASGLLPQLDGFAELDASGERVTLLVASDQPTLEELLAAAQP